MPTTTALIDPGRPGSGAPLALAPGVWLRPLAEADVEPLAAGMAAIDPWRGLGYSAATLAGYWRRADAGAARLAVECDGRLGGALCVRPRWLRGAFLELLCLLPQAQGRGLGRALLHWLAAEARGLGPFLWTSVDADNARAFALYRAAGFTEAARLPGLLLPDRDEVLLRRDLTRPEAM